MRTDTRANGDQLFVALISFVPPASFRDAGEFEPFDTVGTAREWAEKRLRESVGRHGSAWDFQVDVARVGRADFDADTWGVVDGNTVARVTWDSRAASVVWQNDGPFDFGDGDDFDM